MKQNLTNKEIIARELGRDSNRNRALKKAIETMAEEGIRRHILFPFFSKKEKIHIKTEVVQRVENAYIAQHIKLRNTR